MERRSPRARYLFSIKHGDFRAGRESWWSCSPRRVRRNIARSERSELRGLSDARVQAPEGATESGDPSIIAISATADDVRHPYSGVLGNSFVDSPEFRCASLRAILLCTSGPLLDAIQIPCERLTSTQRQLVTGDKIGANLAVAMMPKAAALVNGSQARSRSLAIQAQVLPASAPGSLCCPAEEQGR